MLVVNLLCLSLWERSLGIAPARPKLMIRLSICAPTPECFTTPVGFMASMSDRGNRATSTAAHGQTIVHFA